MHHKLQMKRPQAAAAPRPARRDWSPAAPASRSAGVGTVSRRAVPRHCGGPVPGLLPRRRGSRLRLASLVPVAAHTVKGRLGSWLRRAPAGGAQARPGGPRRASHECKAVTAQPGPGPYGPAAALAAWPGKPHRFSAALWHGHNDFSRALPQCWRPGKESRLASVQRWVRLRWSS